MTLDQYFDWLYQVGTGWMGWTHEQTLATPMPCIELAYKGRVDMWRRVFGGEEIVEEKPPATVKDIKALMRSFM